MHQFTPDQEQFIKANYLNLSKGDIAKHCNTTQSIITGFYKRNRLIVPPEAISKFRTKALLKRNEKSNLKYPFWNNGWHPVTGYVLHRNT